MCRWVCVPSVEPVGSGVGRRWETRQRFPRAVHALSTGGTRPVGRRTYPRAKSLTLEVPSASANCAEKVPRKRLVWRSAGYAAPALHSPRPEIPLKLARKWLRNGGRVFWCFYADKGQGRAVGHMMPLTCREKRCHHGGFARG